MGTVSRTKEYRPHPSRGSHFPPHLCFECGARLFGRSDKRFCGDGCRNAFHNRNNREKNAVIRSVNRRLRRNYQILGRLLKRQPGFAVSRAELVQMGFDFDYCTRQSTGRTGAVYWVYDLVCIRMGKGQYRIGRSGPATGQVAWRDSKISMGMRLKKGVFRALGIETI